MRVEDLRGRRGQGTDPWLAGDRMGAHSCRPRTPDLLLSRTGWALPSMHMRA